VVATAPERNRHLLTRKRVDRALDAAIDAAGLPCVAPPDGATVRIDAATACEPDAAVVCGAIDLDRVGVDDPVVLVEVVSPGSRSVDAGVKLRDHFRLPSLRHHLILDPVRRFVVHHARGEGDRVETRVAHDGALDLSPPGPTGAVADLFLPGG
jgi:Uma2 family endonuclease